MAPHKLWSGYEFGEGHVPFGTVHATMGLTPCLAKRWTVVWSDGTKTDMEWEPVTRVPEQKPGLWVGKFKPEVGK